MKLLIPITKGRWWFHGFFLAVNLVLTVTLLLDSSIGFAQSFTQNDLNSVLGQTPFYDSTAQACSTDSFTTNATSSAITNLTLSYTNPSVGVTVYYPTDGQEHPLVLFAPGLNQDSTTTGIYASFLSSLASQGFVVAGINFPDKSSNITEDAQIVDTLTTELKSEPQLQGKVNFADGMGMVGHSNGGVISTRVGYGTGTQDPDITADMSLDGALGGAVQAGPPMLLFQGTADTVDPNGNDPVYSAVTAPYKAYAKFVDADHAGYFTGSTTPGVSNYSPWQAGANALTAAFFERFLGGENDSSTDLSSVAARYSSQIQFQETGNDTPTNTSSGAASSSPTTTGGSSSASSGSCACSSSSSTTTLSGADNGQKIFNFLTDKGLSPAQAAGVEGNLMQESHLDPSAHQTANAWNDMGTDSNQAVGLAQWDGGNRPAMISAAEKAGLTLQDLESSTDQNLSFQVQYIWTQMQGTAPTGAQNVAAGLKAIDDPAQAAAFFDKNFESGSDPNNIREQYAQQMLQQYGNTAPTGTVTSSTGCGSGSVDCGGQSVTGDAAIACDVLKYDTLSYSQGWHSSGSVFHSRCPSIGPQCATDCSGLVNIAVYDIFGNDINDTTYTEVTDTANFEKISVGQLQPGDLVQPAVYGGDHVIVVEQLSGTPAIGSSIQSFAANQSGVPQPDQVSEQPYTLAAGDVFLRYIGPGSSGS